MSSKPRLCLIAAIARNGVIGKHNALPWRLSADLKHFRALTMGHPIIMGRRNWESIGRPLPGRENIVITRDRHYAAPGCRVVHSLDEAIAACSGHEQAFIIGGAEIYAQALPLVSVLYLTEVDAEVEGDVHFPPFDRSRFKEISREHHEADDAHPYAFDFVVYQLIQP